MKREIERATTTEQHQSPILTAESDASKPKITIEAQRWNEIPMQYKCNCNQKE